MNDSSLFSNKSFRIAVTSALAVLTLFLLAETVSALHSTSRPSAPATDTITVSATGEAAMAPDVARVTFTVQNTAAAVSDAQTKTTEQANKAIDYVKGQGVAEKDVKTLSYNINPQYSYPRPCAAGEVCSTYYDSPKITGYQVSQTVQVTMRDLTKVGALLSGLGKLGVQNVSGPSFGLDDESAGYDAARADAIAKAKAQAKLLAKQLGVDLGKIVSFSESSGYRPYPVMAYGMGGDVSYTKAESVPSIPTGENTYNASVSITYEIE